MLAFGRTLIYVVEEEEDKQRRLRYFVGGDKTF